VTKRRKSVDISKAELVYMIAKLRGVLPVPREFWQDEGDYEEAQRILGETTFDVSPEHDWTKCGERVRSRMVELEAEVEKINAMSREEMAQLWRFAPSSHPYFDTTFPLHAVFKKRFKELGGFSSRISKKIGW